MILAFDCATKTGWCAGVGDDLPILGSVTMPEGVEPGPFLAFWRKWLVHHFKDIGPTVVVFEAPLLPQKTSISTVRKLVGLASVLEMVCVELGIPCEEVNLATVKKHLTGDGRAEKPDMLRAARNCGVSPKSYDEADAFGIWLTAIRYHAKEHQARWDAQLYAGRGLV